MRETEGRAGLALTVLLGGNVDGVAADALSLAGVGQHLDAVVGVALQVVQDHLQPRRRHKVRVTLVCNVNNTHVTLVKEKGVCRLSCHN